jgi:SAM-dependent methyltransferase
MMQYSEACDRNKIPILDILADAFASSSAVLEIGAGTGQHAVFLAERLGHLRWQPTDRAPALNALSERLRQEGPENCNAPVALDADDRPWPAAIVDRRFDAVFTANTLHIMSWDSVESLFDGIGPVLADGGTLCVYGPFRYAGRFTTPSNERFDAALRARDPLSGIRDIESVNELAARHGLQLTSDHAMPANNQLIVWSRAR